MTAENPLVRLGIVADPQYAAIAPRLELDRHYAASLDKLRAAVAVFNEVDLAFVMTLGDIIDRDFQSYDDILPIYGALRHPSRFLLGNHDFSVAPEHLPGIVARLGMPAAYYDFSAGGYRFIVLDGNEVSLFAPPPGDPRRLLAEGLLAHLSAQGAPNAQPWNAALGDAQFAWLGDRLRAAAAAGEPVIVMGHYPLWPPNAHNMWDAERILDLLTAFPNFHGYFCGHNHDGNFATVDCSRKVRMSCFCKVGMSHSPGLNGVWEIADGIDCDERARSAADRSFVEGGCWPDDHGVSGACA